MVIDLDTRKVFTLLSACSGGDERLKEMIMNDLKATDYYNCILVKDDYIYISEKAKILKKRLDEFESNLNITSILFEGELILKELMTAFISLSKSSSNEFLESEVAASPSIYFIDMIHKNNFKDYTQKLKTAIHEKLLCCVKCMDINNFKSIYRPRLDSYEDMLNYFVYISEIIDGKEENNITNFNTSNILEAFEKEVISNISEIYTYRNIILTDDPQSNISAMLGKDSYYSIKQDDYCSLVYKIKEKRVSKGQCCFCGKSLGIVERCKVTTCSKHRLFEEYGERR